MCRAGGSSTNITHVYGITVMMITCGTVATARENERFTRARRDDGVMSVEPCAFLTIATDERIVTINKRFTNK